MPVAIKHLFAFRLKFVSRLALQIETLTLPFPRHDGQRITVSVQVTVHFSNSHLTLPNRSSIRLNLPTHSKMPKSALPDFLVRQRPTSIL